MSTGIQTALRILLTIFIFSIIMGIVFSIVGGQDVRIVNMLIEVLTGQFVGN